MHTCICICIHIYIYVMNRFVYIHVYLNSCMYIYIYIYIEREREREISSCPLDNNLYPYRAVVDRFLLVGQHLHVRVKESLVERHL